MALFMDKCFPLKVRTIRSTDDPWISIGIRKKVRLRKRIFKQHGRNGRWKSLKKITEAKIKEAKYRYFKKMTEKSKATNNIALYYRAMGMIKTREAPRKWDVRELFPGKSDLEIGELLAEYFGSISQEFCPLTRDHASAMHDAGEERIER